MNNQVIVKKATPISSFLTKLINWEDSFRKYLLRVKSYYEVLEIVQHNHRI